MNAVTVGTGVLLLTCMTAACSEKTEQRTREAGQQAAEAAQAAGRAAESAAQDAVAAARDATSRGEDAVNAAQTRDTAREKANEAADAAAAAAQTAMVKGALVISKEVDASGIDVDTNPKTKTIVLKGHVPTAAQKSAALRIAEVKASTGYAVRNDLVVKK